MGERARSTATPGRGRGGNGKRAEQPQSSVGGRGRGREAGKTQAPEPAGGRKRTTSGSGRRAEGPQSQVGGRAATAGRVQASEPAGGRRGSRGGGSQAVSAAAAAAARDGRKGAGRQVSSPAAAACRDVQKPVGAATGVDKAGERGGGGRRRTLRTVAETLRLEAEKISIAAKLVNEVVDSLMEAIKKRGEFKDTEKLTTGSYYEGVKISKPNEFDIMLKLPFENVQLQEFDYNGGAFYYVKLKKAPRRDDFHTYLDENGYLLSSRMLSELRKIIKEEISEKKMNVSVERKKPGCPAVTLLVKGQNPPISVDIVLALEVQQKWPSNTNDGLKIKGWLGSKVREDFTSQPFYLVPKQAKHGKTATETWRISFSHIEKQMLNNHGHGQTCCELNAPKCCRKFCLRLMKHLLQNLQQKNGKNLDKFCSYHLKTTLFHACVSRPNDEQWQLNDLDDCFDMLLGDFEKHLQEKYLPHFFIPNFNLFDSREIDQSSLDSLLKKIKLERDNKFHIFEE
ncbi:cyclic GMP-AMP synthase [Rhinatrema bivittatum]|uniref:cyclic GMP-AMP synthase n=1 Tax=Rhinatrema bivittatum TaxID=194408 RepID=UPI001128F8FE|nr:cyclic GMP-AMP synthase [Rhinatrema bivittatum]